MNNQFITDTPAYHALDVYEREILNTFLENSDYSYDELTKFIESLNEETEIEIKEENEPDTRIRSIKSASEIRLAKKPEKSAWNTVVTYKPKIHVKISTRTKPHNNKTYDDILMLVRNIGFKF